MTFGPPDHGRLKMAITIEATTIGDLLVRAGERWPDADALVLPESRHTFGDLAQRSVERARALIALGVRPGEHVAMFLPTSAEFAEILFGVALAGAVPVPINARYRGNELRYLVDNSDSVAVVTTTDVAEGVNLLERLSEALGDNGTAEIETLRAIVSLHGEAPGVIGPRAFAGLAGDVPVAEVHNRRLQMRLRDTGIVLYTSGTTSNPKGCLLSHEAIVRNGIELARRYEMSGQDRFWSPLAMYHIGGIMPIAASFWVGCRYVTMPRFEAGLALRLLKDEGVTINYAAFWPIIADLIDHPDFATTDLSGIRLMNSSLAMQPEPARRTLDRAMPNAFQVSTYGLTEAAGTVSTSRLDDSYETRIARLGTPLQGLEVRIVDSDGSEVPPGEHGEIAIRGYGIIDGYYKDREKTAAALRDGWLHTGDIGSVDAAGHVMFHGRTKDMLKVGGENVAALEVEALVGSHPDVKLCQVVGCPDDRLVEVPAAFVELRVPGAASEEDIVAFCKGKVAGFKVPQHVRFVSDWPMGATKIQKFKLRNLLIEELGLAGKDAPG